MEYFVKILCLVLIFVGGFCLVTELLNFFHRRETLQKKRQAITDDLYKLEQNIEKRIHSMQIEYENLFVSLEKLKEEAAPIITRIETNSERICSVSQKLCDLNQGLCDKLDLLDSVLTSSNVEQAQASSLIAMIKQDIAQEQRIQAQLLEMSKIRQQNIQQQLLGQNSFDLE